MNDEKRLKDFPHIYEKVKLLWGYPELFAFMEELLFDNRCDRQGFPISVMQEIHLLYNIHTELVYNPTKKRDIWDR
jgi:hypothetical protein